MVAIKTTVPLQQTPNIVSKTALKLPKLSDGNSEFKIQLYGVPPILRIIFTVHY